MEPFKLKAWTSTLNADVHTPGDGVPCETCDMDTAAVKRAPNPEWWGQQIRATERRIQAAETALARYFDPDPLSAANNNWRHRDAAVHRQIDAAKRAGQWQEELKAAKARLAWLEERRPDAR